MPLYEKLQTLTLVGPTRDNLVLDPLVVPHFDNRLYITIQPPQPPSIKSFYQLILIIQFLHIMFCHIFYAAEIFGGVESIKEIKLHRMFKGLWFWCGTASGFFRAASKTIPNKNRTYRNTAQITPVGMRWKGAVFQLLPGIRGTV